MARKKGIANRRYTAEFKAQAMALGRSIGGNEAAMRLGMPESSLWNWLKAKAPVKNTSSASAQASVVPDTAASVKRTHSSKASGLSANQVTRNQVLAQENADLKRRLADSQADLAILKKAAAYFARESK